MAQKAKEPNCSEQNDSSLVNVRKKVKKVDFKREIESFVGDKKPLAKHYQIIAINKLLDIDKGFRYTESGVYSYNGAFWDLIDRDDFKAFLGTISEKMGINKLDAIHYKYRDELLNQFCSVAYAQAPEIDKDMVKINLLNGTLEINNGSYKLAPFNKKDFFTYQLDFDYDTKATAPIFNKYLNRVLPNKDVQDILCEYIGYVFIRNGGMGIKMEKILALSGSGANGKSVFFEVIRALIGKQNISNYSLQELTDSQGRYRYAFKDMLLNYCSETSSKVGESLLKQIASGEPISAKAMYKQPSIISQYAKIIFNINKPLANVEHTPAFFRRFLPIPFDVTIPLEERDNELHTKIINAELSGVMNWVLSGLDRLLKNKSFTQSDIVDRALNKFKTESNSVALFLEERNYYVSQELSKSIDIYQLYDEFCRVEGYHKCSHIEFNRRLGIITLNGKKVIVDRSNVGKVVNITVDE